MAEVAVLVDSRGRGAVVDRSVIILTCEDELGREGDRRRDGVIGVVVEEAPSTESIDVLAVDGMD